MVVNRFLRILNSVGGFPKHLGNKFASACAQALAQARIWSRFPGPSPHSRPAPKLQTDWARDGPKGSGVIRFIFFFEFGVFAHSVIYIPPVPLAMQPARRTTPISKIFNLGWGAAPHRPLVFGWGGKASPDPAMENTSSS